jgi:HPt (histidine-containing phosphotransfer) domain-containing protein
MENISHNQDLFKELIEMTPEQFSGDIALLKSSIDKNESENIRKAAHAIKGVSLGMCFIHLAELARGIELDAEKEPPTKIKARFDELFAEWVQIIEIIRKLEF